MQCRRLHDQSKWNSRIVELKPKQSSNLADAPLQMALGFSKGRNEAEAQQFAAKVEQTLSKKWVIHEVPQNRGAFPLKKCDYVAHSV